MLCVVIVVPLTMFLLGPFGKYLGDYTWHQPSRFIIGVNSLVAGMIIRLAYSFIVLFGLHLGYYSGSLFKHCPWR
ncbi:hypothetical protein LNP74_32115 [Klebsiella pneumoniae subsp. pneumoniae]|nr:hypothetical protein [Klebsiella pneumoniae subsp. pneumoniae]